MLSCLVHFQVSRTNGVGRQCGGEHPRIRTGSLLAHWLFPLGRGRLQIRSGRVRNLVRARASLGLNVWLKRENIGDTVTRPEWQTNEQAMVVEVGLKTVLVSFYGKRQAWDNDGEWRIVHGKEINYHIKLPG